jgi:hypothetical protein
MIIRRTDNRGLIKGIVIFLVILLIIAYFGLNLRSIVASQTFQDNWNFLVGIATSVWDHFLSRIWNIFWNLVLSPLLSRGITQMQQGSVSTSTLNLLP